MPEDDDCGEVEWRTQACDRLPAIEHPCYSRDSSHQVPLPPSSTRTQADEEVGVRRLERISFHSIASRGHPLHHIHHCLGKIPLPHRPPRVQGFRWRIHCQIRQSGPRHHEQNKVRRRHSDMVCGHRASIQRRCPLANEMWHQWYHPQPEKNSIPTRHSAIRWFRNQHVHRQASQEVHKSHC